MSRDFRGDRDRRVSRDLRGDRDRRVSRDFRGDRDRRVSRDLRGDRDRRVSRDFRGDRDRRVSRDLRGDRDRRARLVPETGGASLEYTKMPVFSAVDDPSGMGSFRVDPGDADRDLPGYPFKDHSYIVKCQGTKRLVIMKTTNPAVLWTSQEYVTNRGTVVSPGSTPAEQTTFKNTVKNNQGTLYFTITDDFATGTVGAPGYYEDVVSNEKVYIYGLFGHQTKWSGVWSMNRLQTQLNLTKFDKNQDPIHGIVDSLNAVGSGNQGFLRLSDASAGDYFYLFDIPAGSAIVKKDVVNIAVNLVTEGTGKGTGDNAVLQAWEGKDVIAGFQLHGKKERPDRRVSRDFRGTGTEG